MFISVHIWNGTHFLLVGVIRFVSAIEWHHPQGRRSIISSIVNAVPLERLVGCCVCCCFSRNVYFYSHRFQGIHNAPLISKLHQRIELMIVSILV
jgi:hypothetical protein